jgi:hypothetical protein
MRSPTGVRAGRKQMTPAASAVLPVGSSWRAPTSNPRPACGCDR